MATSAGRLSSTSHRTAVQYPITWSLELYQHNSTFVNNITPPPARAFSGRRTSIAYYAVSR